MEPSSHHSRSAAVAFCLFELPGDIHCDSWFHVLGKGSAVTIRPQGKDAEDDGLVV